MILEQLCKYPSKSCFTLSDMRGKPGQGLPHELVQYQQARELKLVTVDVNVSDVTIGAIRLTETRIYPAKRLRVKRPIHLISFVRKINRYSMKVHKRPASSWLAYLRARENQWINDSVATIIRTAKDFDAALIVVEDLNARALRQKLRSKDPELAQRYSTWPIAKILRRLERACEKRGIKLMKVPPQFSSHICPRCHSIMTDHGRRRVKCPRCGMEDDRDHVSIINLAKTAAIMLGIQYLEAPIRFILRDYEKRFPAQGPLRAPGSGEAKGETPNPPPGTPQGDSWVGGLMNLMPRTLSRSQPKARAAKRVSPAPPDGK
ncbi:MAG: transposase [Nitrososphaerota archaeon]